MQATSSTIATTPCRNAVLASMAMAASLLLTSAQGQVWEGWSTQTQFGCGDGSWPYEPNRGKTTLILADIQPLTDGHCDGGNNRFSTFGVALPWRYVCKQYGSRDAYVQAVYDAWYGTSKAPVCLEMQPINRVPANIADGSYDLPSLSTNPANNASVNSDGIVAKQSNGAPYPKFQLVPYEGCGGNCIWQPGTSGAGQGSSQDCYNSCYGVAGQNQQAALNCEFSWAAGDPTCVGMYELWGGGSWPNSGGNFADYSAAYAINYSPVFPAPIAACNSSSQLKGNWYKNSAPVDCIFANWCNGINFHGDWTFSGPAPWGGLVYAPYPNPSNPDAAGPATQFGGDPTYENIMFRYRHVPCRNWHDTLGAGTPYPNIRQCWGDCGNDGRCIKRCRSTCGATCKRLAGELKGTICAAMTGNSKAKCEYRVKAFLYGCQSVCAEPQS